MAEFAKESAAASAVEAAPSALISVADAITVVYCPVCTMPPEFCEYGTCFDKCLPWILKNCPGVVSENAMTKALAKLNIEDIGEGVSADVVAAAAAASAVTGEEPQKTEKERGGGAAAPKKAKVWSTKIVITRVQRQKRKFVTSIVGVDTIPDVKLKDASKLFGKKFASGAAVSDLAGGGKEIVIQGDVSFELPSLLISEYKVEPSDIWFSDNKGNLTCNA